MKNEDKSKEKKAPPELVDVKLLNEIIGGIFEQERIKQDAADAIKNLKSRAVEAGLSKEQLNEAIRLAKMDDEDRNLMLSGANIALKATGRQPIDLFFMGQG